MIICPGRALKNPKDGARVQSLSNLERHIFRIKKHVIHLPEPESLGPNAREFGVHEFANRVERGDVDHPNVAVHLHRLLEIDLRGTLHDAVLKYLYFSSIFFFNLKNTRSTTLPYYPLCHISSFSDCTDFFKKKLRDSSKTYMSKIRKQMGDFFLKT